MLSKWFLLILTVTREGGITVDSVPPLPSRVLYTRGRKWRREVRGLA